MSGEEAWVAPELRWGWFELSPGVNNLHTFAIEKKAQRREECATRNTVVSHLYSQSLELFPSQPTSEESCIYTEYV
jgi:hypothetical protein